MLELKLLTARMVDLKLKLLTAGMVDARAKAAYCWDGGC